MRHAIKSSQVLRGKYNRLRCNELKITLKKLVISKKISLIFLFARKSLSFTHFYFFIILITQQLTFLNVEKKLTLTAKLN